MRLSHLFSQTLREVPTETEVISHQLLVRAGFIKQLGAGIFSYLPLAQRSLKKIMQVMREEIDAIGGQEICMPVVHPAEIWQETGRWYQIGSEMGRFKDKTGHDMVLAMTHEEIVADLVRGLIHSYRQLPALVYHIQTKWRDDPRPRAGLIRVREFTMLDSYSLDRDFDGLDRQYEAHYQAYFRIFKRCGLDVTAVRSDTGMMGGKMAHEYMYLAPIGEDSLLFCDGCGYSANRQVAAMKKPLPAAQAQQPLQKMATPHASTIEELATFLNIPQEQTAKAVFFVGKFEDIEKKTEYERFVFAVVRGDMEVNESKLANVLHAKELRPAQDEEIKAVGAAPGYASPVGLKGVLVVVDDLIPHSPNLAAGANEEGYHLLNVNYGRDYGAAIVADIIAAADGSLCPECGQPMRLARGVEVGNIFKLGTRYSDALGCIYLDENGATKPVVMGSYGIGVGRLLACAAEEHHDERGLVWPAAIAPYTVHLVALAGKTMDTLTEAEKLEKALTAAGLEPLYDDREESAGVKFNDADLIGLPLRITVSERALKAGGAEFKLRSGSDPRIVPLADVVSEAKKAIDQL